jgi:Mg/Co/Ni transporter MgtE
MTDRRDKNIQKSEPPMEEIREQINGLLELEELVELKKFLEHTEPEDIAEVLGDFSPEEKVVIFNSLKVSDAAVVLDDTDPQSRLQILQKLDSSVLSSVFAGVARLEDLAGQWWA